MPKLFNNSRDNIWISSRLKFIWSNYFADVEEVNPLQIKFGRYSKYRLGSIKLNRKDSKSLITVTSMFKNKNIPTEVVDHTLAHELVHYAHGFSSKRIRLHKYPHAGGVVNKEMRDRGMGHLILAYHTWVKTYRLKLLKDGK